MAVGQLARGWGGQQQVCVERSLDYVAVMIQHG